MGIVDVSMRLIFVFIVTVCTWYGPEQTNGDPYVAAYWHRALPDGAPSRVDYHYLGAASASRDIPFGTKVRLEIVGIPKWAKGEYDHLIGRSVIVTVVDRMGSEGDGFDLWPASARRLMGPDYRRIGIVYIKARVIGEGNGY